MEIGEELLWRNALIVLSLDFSRAVYSDIGVCVPQQETVRGIARDCLLRRFAPELSSSSGILYDPELTFDEAIPSEFLSRVEQALGHGASELIKYWVLYVVNTELDNPWVQYQDIFLSWASRWRRCCDDSLGIGSESHRLEAKLRSCLDVAGLRSLLEVRRLHNLSEWDAPIFGALGVAEIPPSSNFFPLVSEFTLYCSISRFQSFFLEVREQLSPEAVREIALMAESSARANGHPFCPPLSLPFRGVDLAMRS